MCRTWLGFIDLSCVLFGREKHGFVVCACGKTELPLFS